MTDMALSQSDFSDERTHTRFRLQEMTAASHDAVVIAGAAIQLAFGNITRGRLRDVTFTHSRSRVSNLPGAADTEAQREERLLLTLEDTVTLMLYSMEIGCVDISALTRYPNTDWVVLADAGPMAAFIVALEAHVISEVGNPINVLRAVLVGRAY